MKSFQIDSRLVSCGDVFFALAGERVDGHAFLEEVRDKGAAGAVVQKGRSLEGLCCVEVENVSEELRCLAKMRYEEMRVPMIGITGSVGKTTTKEFLAALLEGSFKVGKSFKSYNSQLTFPLMLLNFSEDVDILVLEMGMSQRGELSLLADIAAPSIAVVTKVALAHAEHFPEGLIEIANAKMELCRNEKVKTVILDHEILEISGALDGVLAEKITFSTKNSSADYYLSLVEGKIRIDERGVRAWEGIFPFQEDHLLHNALAAIAAARQVGVKWDKIEEGIKHLVLPPMRFERLEKKGVLWINDAYNANPTSMRAALESLPKPKEGGKTIAVLGSMKELGIYSKGAHTEIGLVAQKQIDHLICYGEETEDLLSSFSEAKKPGERLKNKEEIVHRLQELICPGDVILLKGSRSLQLEDILEEF